MRICVLTSSTEHSLSPFAPYDPPCSPAPYAPQHRWHHAAVGKATAVAQLQALAAAGFDCFVNLCDGAWDEDRAGLEVVQALEKLGQAYTGAGPESYEPSREAMKRACHYAGVAVPGWVVIPGGELGAGIDKALRTLSFPMIVKHPSSYGSVGMTRASRCTTAAELRTQVERTALAYGDALVEEFIEGREFTALVAEPALEGQVPRTWPAIEFNFPPGESFKHFDLKWIDWQGMDAALVGDAALDLRLREAAAALFAGLGCSGYGRCDLRMDSQGRLFMLEINPNCGIFYPAGSFGSADFALAAYPGGHGEFLAHIVDCALRRQARQRPLTRSEFVAHQGYHMVAARDFAAGELVQPGEERSHVLVSRRHVEQHWTTQQKQWFAQYAWPISDDIHVMWAARPEDWQPIDHSCDPNTWLDGLDLVARRPIAQGEAVAVDYATFCGPRMQAFDCRCGAQSCRGVIRPSDHLISALEQVYAGHWSAFVEAARQKLAAASPNWAYRLHPRGNGQSELVAARALRPGEEICAFRPLRSCAQPGRHTLQVSERDHVELDPPELTFINHSCAPNAAFDVERGLVAAIRPIACGEPITAFYPATEWQMAEAFACHCGEPGCLGIVQGAKALRGLELPAAAWAPHIRDLFGRAD